jgi:hypothetical protein
VQLPSSLLQSLESAAKPRPLRWWQVSLRTLFLLTAVCAVLALLAMPALAWAREIWEAWFPVDTGCGPCGMG